MSRPKIPANAMRHSKLQGILAMIPTIEDQLRTFTSWRLGSRQLSKDLIDILDLIKTNGDILKSALMSLQSVYDGLSNDRRHSDDVVAALEKKNSVDLSKEVAGARDVFVAVNAAGSDLSTPSSNFALGKIWRPSRKEALVSFGNHFAQLKSHLRIIEMMARRLRHASRTGTKDVSDVFLREYAGLESMHSKQVLEGLRSRFDQDPFAVTVPLDPEREQSEEEGRDYAEKVYDYSDNEEELKVFLKQFQVMGSKWAAATLGGSSTPDMRTLEMAYTKLSCGVMSALQQSVPRDEGTPRLWEDTDFLQCRLEQWEKLTSGQKIIIAIGGHFSHGKSSFLNSLMGEDVLPTDKAFTTAIPCRIQHKADAELTLEIPQLKPYQTLLTRVTDYSISHTINRIPDVSMVKEAADFVKRCKEAKFLEDPRASSQATKLVFTERKTVREQLDLINNLVRLSSQLRDSKPLELDSPRVWPIITYDIAVLSLGNVTANVQFLDLPGFNDEVFSPTGQSALFYSMMKHAAEEATLIIPVVSLPAVNENFGAMWTEWERTLYQKRWKDRIPVVVVTKAAQEDHNRKKFELLQNKIAIKVWKTDEQCDRVLFCDSLIGLGVMQFERLFNECIKDQVQENAEWKPQYSLTLAKNIQDPSSPMHHLKVFAKPGFSEYQRKGWSRFLGMAQYVAGVEEFNTFLASKICEQSPRRRLEAFHQIFPAAFQKLISMHEQAIRDSRMSKEEFDKIASQAEGDTKKVEEGLKVWKTMTDDIIARRTQPTRNFRKQFEVSVRGEWEEVKKELEKSLLASSQDGLRKFSNRTEYRCHVDPYINKLARSFAVIQAQHVDNILEIVSQGVQEVIDAVDTFTNNTITDASWKEIVNMSLKEFRDIPNVLVSRLKSKIKGTAADRNYTTATLLESLLNWVPLTDEPFDRPLAHAPQTQNATNQESITRPVTPTTSLPIQLSEMNLVAATPEPCTNNHTPDEPQHTAKEWAYNEFKDTGFLIYDLSPDQWLDILPTDDALDCSGVDAKTMEVKVNIGELLSMIETKFVNPYIKTIVEKTYATSCGWLEKTAEVCQQRFEELMRGRKEELNQRSREQGGTTGTRVTRVVRHLMAIANLTAATAAIRCLQDAVVEWDRQLTRDGADILVTCISSPRASTVIP